jgi:diguanylate cyclase (GGDEF)-like protein
MHGMRVLIAEDDTVSRLILTELLQKLGHECLTTADGQEAWELFSRCGADVVISDWMMPGMDGLEFCRRVRESARATYTYFILLTALSDKHHFLTGMQEGADDYLTKPLDRDELQARLVAAARVTSLHRRLADQNEELERLNRELWAQARRDPLTGLYNRLQLREDLGRLRAWVERHQRLQCVALCDLDRFKAYNDRYGHLTGDEMLCRVADVLREIRHQGGAAYRYGGEEFCLWLPERSLTAAIAALNRVREDVESLAIEHAGNAPSEIVTISAGVAALKPGDGKTADVLLRQADEALYQAKESGRNRVIVYRTDNQTNPSPEE